LLHLQAGHIDKVLRLLRRTCNRIQGSEFFR